MKRKAFTLIELLVTVAIIAVIGAGVAVFYGRDVVDDAKRQMTIHEMGQIRDAFLRFWAENSTQMMNGMTVADTTADLPDGDFDFIASDDFTYTTPTTSNPQRFYGAMQAFERYGLWPLLRDGVRRLDETSSDRIQVFRAVTDERKYTFKVPSPLTGEGWRGPYLNATDSAVCTANGKTVEMATKDGASRKGVTSGNNISETAICFPQPKTKYDDANGGIYRVIYYEHCPSETTGQPIYRRLLLMAAQEPMRYDEWSELQPLLGNRRFAAATGEPLDVVTGAVKPYDAARGLFFMELLNFDTVYR